MLSSSAEARLARSIAWRCLVLLMLMLILVLLLTSVHLQSSHYFSRSFGWALS